MINMIILIAFIIGMITIYLIIFSLLRITLYEMFKYSTRFVEFSIIPIN